MERDVLGRDSRTEGQGHTKEAAGRSKKTLISLFDWYEQEKKMESKYYTTNGLLEKEIVI
jgi:hypothetical protein